MTIQPITLHPSEAVQFDHDVLDRICTEHGHNAEAVIARLLSHIEQNLRLAQHQLARNERSGLARTCVDLQHLAHQLGMKTLSVAATAVLDCLDNGQDAALAACCNRMFRLGSPETIDHWTVQTGTVA